METAVLAIVGTAITLLLFFLLRTYPMAALRNALDMLSREKGRATVTLQSIGDGVISTDPEDRILIVNRMAERITGWTQAEAAGKPIREVFNPEGDVLVDRNGTSRRIEAGMSPVLDERGRGMGTVHVFRDVTEKAQTEAAMVNAQKLESLGVLAGGIAHEIRNPLSSINISISSIERACGASTGLEPETKEKFDRILEQMKSAAAKMGLVVQRVMDYSKPFPPRKESVDLNVVIEEAIRLSLSTLRKREITVLRDLAPDLTACRVDAQLIEQVLVNLITNACQAMEGDRGTETPRDRVRRSGWQDRPARVRLGAGSSPFPPGEGLRSLFHHEEGGVRDRTQLQPPDRLRPRRVVARRRESVGGGGVPDRSPRRKGRGFGMIPYSLFIVDDEDTIRRTLAIAFEGRYRLADFPDAESAVAAARVDPPDLVLLDLGLPGMSGIEAIPVFRAIAPEILIVVITAYEDVKSVVSAMKGGAYDYVVKPLDIDTLEMCIGNALESIRLKKEVQALQERYLRENLPCFIGESNTIRDVMEFVGLLARSPDTPVLILGETGTGKELIASAIHYRSPNFRGPLISVNCAAIPRELIESELFGYEKGAFSGASAAGKKGMVEQAEGGTLFLDEIGDLTPEAQAKLLRFLEEGEYYRVGGTRKLTVRARVVSATNKNLRELIAKGLFREDLYYRLAVARVELPSLTERQDDIIPIALHFLLEFNRKFGRSFSGISRDAREALMQYRWKGNVRELRNFVERGVLVGRGPELTRRDLDLGEENVSVDRRPAPEEILHPLLPPGGVDLVEAHESLDRHFFGEALRLTEGNETRAAQLLRINYSTFRYRRRKLGI